MSRRACTPLLLALLAAGCRTPQMTARQEAQLRWDRARAQVKLRLAAEQLRRGNLAQAAGELARAGELDPALPGLAPLRARILLAQGRTRAALDVLAEAQRRGEAEPEVHYLAGVAHQQRLEWTAALESYLHAAEADPADAEYFAAVVEALLQLDLPAAALDFVESRQADLGALPVWHAARAECLEQLGRWDEAAAAWQVAGAENPDPLVLERQAAALLRAGRAAEAVTVLQQRCARRPTPGRAVRLALAEALLESGQPDAARREVEQLAGAAPDPADPRDLPVHMLLARIEARSGRFDAALQRCLALLRAGRNAVPVLELAAGLACRQGLAAQAAGLCAQLMALEPGNLVAQEVLAALRAPSR